MGMAGKIFLLIIRKQQDNFSGCGFPPIGFMIWKLSTPTWTKQNQIRQPNQFWDQETGWSKCLWFNVGVWGGASGGFISPGPTRCTNPCVTTNISHKSSGHSVIRATDEKGGIWLNDPEMTLSTSFRAVSISACGSEREAIARFRPGKANISSAVHTYYVPLCVCSPCFARDCPISSRRRKTCINVGSQRVAFPYALTTHHKISRRRSIRSTCWIIKRINSDFSGG